MEVKPGYKQTEVGLIPEGWMPCVLHEACERISVGLATSVTQHYRTSGVPIVRNLNIREGYFDGRDMLYIAEAFAKANASKAAKALDVLTVHTGSNLGDTCVLPGEFDNCQTFTTLITTPRVSVLDPYFLCLHMSSFAGKMEMKRLEVGGGKGNLNTGDLKHYRLPIPPLPEQRAIAGALSDVDALLGALDQLIAKKRDLKQAAMQQLLTGQTRLPGFHGEWEVKRLGDVAVLKNGYAFKSDTYTSLGTFKVITIANVQDGYMTADACNTVASKPTDLQPHQRLGVDDILISMTGNVGRVCRVDEQNCFLNQRVGKLIPTSIEDGLLFALLRQPSFILAMTGVAKGGAQPNLSASDIADHLFSIPKDATEQTAIAEVLMDMDAELAALEQRRAKTRGLKQGMMQELLTGRTRLV